MKMKDAESWAEIYGAEVSPHGYKVLQMIEKNNGRCPCVVGESSPPCPCEGLVKIRELGSCKCGLFRRRD